MIRKWHSINIYNGNFGPVEITLILTNTQFYFMKHLIQSKFRIFAILAIAAIFGQVSAFAQQRAITGTVLYAAEGKLTAEDIPVILDSGDRTLAGPTVPPGGLYLTKLWYEDERLNG